MKTHSVLDAEGRVVAFEVKNAGLSRRHACRLLFAVPGGHPVRRPKCLSWFRESAFCEANIGGVTFVAEEPFGDNSRFLIGPVPLRPVAELGLVRRVFDDAPRSPLWLRALLIVVFVVLVAIGLLFRR